MSEAVLLYGRDPAPGTLAALFLLGEVVAVLGSGVHEGDPTGMPPGGYRSAPPTRLRLTSSPRFPLVISDDPSTTQ